MIAEQTGALAGQAATHAPLVALQQVFPGQASGSLKHGWQEPLMQTPEQVAPQSPQLRASVRVSTQVPGVPQQVGVSPLQALPPPHWHWWLTQSLPAGAQSASAQQIPLTQAPPQQISSPGQGLSGEQSVHTVSAEHTGSLAGQTSTQRPLSVSQQVPPGQAAGLKLQG